MSPPVYACTNDLCSAYGLLRMHEGACLHCEFHVVRVWQPTGEAQPEPEAPVIPLPSRLKLMQDVVNAARAVDDAFRAYTRVSFEETPTGIVAVVRLNPDELKQQTAVLGDLREALIRLDEAS